MGYSGLDASTAPPLVECDLLVVSPCAEGRSGVHPKKAVCSMGLPLIGGFVDSVIGIVTGTVNGIVPQVLAIVAGLLPG